jgi:hypothetical protein
MRDLFGRQTVERLIGGRLTWLDIEYNRLKTVSGSYSMTLIAWAYDAEAIEPVDVGDYNGSMTGWKRLS